jgi:DNA-binding transcriptional regulator YiaG
MCKHVAAVLYGVGSRLDHAPEKLFLLRGVNHEELVDLTATLQEATTSKSSRRRIAGSGLADVFGVDLADADAPPLPVRRPGKAAVPAVSTPVAGKETDKQPAKSPRLKKTVAVPAKLPEPVTGEAILAWRTRLHETQAVFAKRLSVTSASISQWEKKGAQTINLQTATLASLRKAWKAARLSKE